MQATPSINHTSTHSGRRCKEVSCAYASGTTAYKSSRGCSLSPLLALLLFSCQVSSTLGACLYAPVDGHVEIPNSLTSISDNAFESCMDLKSISFEAPCQVATIGERAFKDSGLTGITIPAQVTTLGAQAFYDCSDMTSVSFRCGVSAITIADDTFGHTDATAPISLALPSTAVYGGSRTLLACAAAGADCSSTPCSTASEFCDADGLVGVVDTCQVTPRGYYPLDEGDAGQSLHACAPGYTTSNKGAIGIDACIACEVGFISNTGNAVGPEVGCVICPVGTYDSGGRKCSPCKPGSIQPNEGGFSAGDCQLASAGKFAPETGSAESQDCAGGTFSPNKGASTCAECNPGTFSSDGDSKCVYCEGGQMSGQGSSTCESCPAGSFSESTMQTCRACPPSTFSATDGAGSCTPCAEGHVSVISGSTQCIACTAGRYSSGTACAMCPAGKYSADAAETCTKCENGKISGDNDTECEGCAGI